MRTDGTNVRRLTSHPAFDNYPVLSPDGTQVAFQSNREDERVEVYLQNLNDDNAAEATHAFERPHRAHAEMLVARRHAHAGLHELEPQGPDRADQREPVPAHLLLSDAAADLGSPRVSRDSKRLLYEARLADWQPGIACDGFSSETDDHAVQDRTGYPIPFHLEPAWSPDNSLIAFSARANSNSEILLAKGRRQRPAKCHEQSYRRISAVLGRMGKGDRLVRDAYGRAQLYRMDVDGTRQRRITHKQGYEMNPALSSDGMHLVFAGDRGRAASIFSFDLTSEPEKPLAARRFHDGSPSFSPDGKRHHVHRDQ